MSSATPLCDLCLTTSVQTFDILLFCTCLDKLWASWILLAPGSFYFLPVTCSVVSGQKILPILVAHPKITDPSHSSFLSSYPEDLPQPLASASAFAHSSLLLHHLNAAENRGKPSALSSHYQSSFFCPKGRHV